MPRKKKQEETPARPEGYNVFIGYVKKFDFDEGAHPDMNGHPAVGRVYRIIQDKEGYRLHIGREKIAHHKLDGLFLDDTLKGKRFGYDFDIVLVTPKNYMKLGLHEDDLQQVDHWLETDNADMWARIDKEINGNPVIRNLQDLINIATQKIAEEDKAEAEKEGPGSLEFNAPDVATAAILADSLNTIADKDEGAYTAIVDFIEYIASTYGDKYESSDIPNIGKIIVTQSPTLGKGANVFNIIKYTQRYGTSGFEKSENIKDIYKAMHYSLFEIQRRKHQGK